MQRTRRERHHVDHRRAPLLEGVVAYQRQGIVPFSTPGHKCGIGADEELRETFGDRTFLSDIPLGGGIGDTHFGGEALRVAEAMASDAWDADRSFFLLNGSTAGNHAFMLATVRPGDKVLVSRDLHKSLLVALILTGVVPVYLAPRLHPELNVGLGISAEEVAAALELHPDTKLIALVSPSYCGVASDLDGIAAVAHARGIPVYVDEAWGPHFHFHPSLPSSAMASGADGAVTSIHKVLVGLTKLVIDVDGLGITGYQAEDALRNRFGVGPEMSDLVGVVCLITIGDSVE